LKEIFGNTFYHAYTYAAGMSFTKVGEMHLSEGKHEIEFRIKKSLDLLDKRSIEDQYIFLLDAIFVVPRDWKPEKKFLTFPDDLFSY